MLDPLDLVDPDEDTAFINVTLPVPDEPTDVPVEIAREISARLSSGPRILFHEGFSLTCRFHDDADGSRILISY